MATTATKTKYFEAVGRRKSAVARVRIFPGASKMKFVVNEKPLEDFFATNELHQTVRDAFSASEMSEKFEVTVKV